MLKKWYSRNRTYLKFVLFASGAIGITLAGICLCFPTVLMACASISIFGVTPLSFLMAIHLPFALLTLTAITTGVAFCAIAIGIIVVKQLANIGMHTYALCAEEDPVRDPLASSTSYDYLQAHLKKREYTQTQGEEYEENRSNSPVDFEGADRPLQPEGFSTQETNSVNAFSR